MSKEKYNPALEWNQNILRNLKFKFKNQLNEIDDSLLLQRFDEWQGFCLSEEEHAYDLLDYLKTGE